MRRPVAGGAAEGGAAGDAVQGRAVEGAARVSHLREGVQQSDAVERGGRLVRGPKVSQHHLALTRDGTVLQQAALEHNCFVVSRLYCNIYTKQLDKLLGTKNRQAERAVARMMEQKRLLGYIDQVKGIIVFDNDLERRLKGNIGSAEIAWDDNVERLGQRVEAVSTMILESQKSRIFRIDRPSLTAQA